MDLSSLGPNTLVKALKADRTHHGLTYVLGLNTCPQPFNDEECADGGLYACRLKDLLQWVSLYHDIDHVALVEVPEDARTKEFATKIKASSLVLTRFLPLTEAMELALQVGHADVHTDNDWALIRASKHGHLPVVQFLISHGADVHALNDNALCWASNNGHLDVVKFLVQVGHANVNADGDNDDGLCSLHRASEHGHLPVVQFLVEHGADVHADNDYALRWASNNGHLDVVKFLIEHGADIHADNDCALRWASSRVHLPVVQFLKSLP